MCTIRTARPAAALTPRVSWKRLYGLVALMALTLTADELVSPKGIVRAALRGTITVATFVAMALWVRSNRAAFDYEDWCDCAAQHITVRVIPSQREEPQVLPLDERVDEPEREGVLT